MFKSENKELYLLEESDRERERENKQERADGNEYWHTDGTYLLKSLFKPILLTKPVALM